MYLLQMLPPGEWHCTNCTCKFCGVASGPVNKEDDPTVHALRTCNLCEKKCIQIFSVEIYSFFNLLCAFGTFYFLFKIGLVYIFLNS